MPGIVEARDFINGLTVHHFDLALPNKSEIKDSNSNSIMLRKRGLLYASDVNKFINHFPGLEYVGTYIRCTFCNLNFAPHGIQTCRRHIKSKRHIANATHQVPYWKFLHDFTFMLSVCNIPQHIVDNDNFRLFWKKLVPSRTLPTKKQLRNNFPRVKTIIEDSIRCDLKNNKIWLSVNKATDAKKNCVLNILVRVLKSDKSSVPYLLSIEIDIREISEKYSVIIKDISKLQNSKLSLAESLNIVHHFNVALDNMRDTVGLLAAEKFHSILDKNPDFQKILYLNQCLSENEDCDVVSEFKYANITSLDVERSFSKKYSKTFSPFRTCLSESTMEALQMLRLYASTLNRTTLMPE
ncbi:hypothetical protein MML48_8g00005594 [Holotrichia oblita]|uniref:Uncharacterized protein n=1 Tax=Holotrichia oblita TaxID=644536 RepID=A0ACB9SLR0_HOLOL|nr:hypothetical protein MML48_8g00005594 [Holotrichia oblita]